MPSSSSHAHPPSGPRHSPTSEEVNGIKKTYQDYPELKKLPHVASALARAILRLPVVRPLDLRPGFALGRSLKNATKPWNLEVSLAYMRGDFVRYACDHCRIRNEGPFSHCVVLDGQFQGSCTNCHYNDHGERCTLRGAQAKARAPARETAIQPSGHDIYRPGDDYSPSLASRIHLARPDIIQDSPYDERPYEYQPPLASRISRDAVQQKRGFDIRSTARSELSLADRITQSPQKSNGEDLQRIGLNQHLSEIQPPQSRGRPDHWSPHSEALRRVDHVPEAMLDERTTIPRNPTIHFESRAIQSKRDSLDAFGGNESFAPPKKRVSFAPETIFITTGDEMRAPSSALFSLETPKGPPTMVQTGALDVLTGPRTMNNSGRRPSIDVLPTSPAQAGNLIDSSFVNRNPVVGNEDHSLQGTSRSIPPASKTRKDEARTNSSTPPLLSPVPGSYSEQSSMAPGRLVTPMGIQARIQNENGPPVASPLQREVSPPNARTSYSIPRQAGYPEIPRGPMQFIRMADGSTCMVNAANSALLTKVASNSTTGRNEPGVSGPKAAKPAHEQGLESKSPHTDVMTGPLDDLAGAVHVDAESEKIKKPGQLPLTSIQRQSILRNSGLEHKNGQGSSVVNSALQQTPVEKPIEKGANQQGSHAAKFPEQTPPEESILTMIAPTTENVVQNTAIPPVLQKELSSGFEKPSKKRKTPPIENNSSHGAVENVTEKAVSAPKKRKNSPVVEDQVPKTTGKTIEKPVETNITARLETQPNKKKTIPPPGKAMDPSILKDSFTKRNTPPTGSSRGEAVGPEIGKITQNLANPTIPNPVQKRKRTTPPTEASKPRAVGDVVGKPIEKISSPRVQEPHQKRKRTPAAGIPEGGPDNGTTAKITKLPVQNENQTALKAGPSMGILTELILEKATNERAEALPGPRRQLEERRLELAVDKRAEGVVDASISTSHVDGPLEVASETPGKSPSQPLMPTLQAPINQTMSTPAPIKNPSPAQEAASISTRITALPPSPPITLLIQANIESQIMVTDPPPTRSRREILLAEAMAMSAVRRHEELADLNMRMSIIHEAFSKDPSTSR